MRRPWLGPGLELGGRGRLGWNWNQDVSSSFSSWQIQVISDGLGEGLTDPWRGVELTASAEVEIGGYRDLHNCINCIGSGFLGPCNCMHQKGHGSMYAPCKQLCQSTLKWYTLPDHSNFDGSTHKTLKENTCKVVGKHETQTFYEFEGKIPPETYSPPLLLHH